MLKTVDDVRHDFEKAGLSIARWAVAHGFNPALVYAVLNGKRRAIRGETHTIAVALGLKRGSRVASIGGESRSEKKKRKLCGSPPLS
jgi:gp16 family phage-associated protein